MAFALDAARPPLPRPPLKLDPRPFPRKYPRDLREALSPKLPPRRDMVDDGKVEGCDTRFAKSRFFRHNNYTTCHESLSRISVCPASTMAKDAEMQVWLVVAMFLLVRGL